MRIQVRRTTSSKPWYFRIVAANNKVIAVSESYFNKSNAVRAAKVLASESALELEDYSEARFTQDKWSR